MIDNARRDARRKSLTILQIKRGFPGWPIRDILLRLKQRGRVKFHDATDRWEALEVPKRRHSVRYDYDHIESELEAVEKYLLKAAELLSKITKRLNDERITPS